MSESLIQGKRVLVTGGAGVIGRELLTWLRSKSALILSVDRYPLPDGDWPGVRHFVKDLAQADVDELRTFRPDIVFHLAATFERSKESPEFWLANWRDNVLLSHRVVEFVNDTPSVDTFVFCSSYLVYSPALYLSSAPGNGPVFLSETNRVEPRNLCGVAKYYTEREVDFLKHSLSRRLRTVHARIFRVYGCGSRDVISRWLRAAASDATIEVYNPENRFDFIFAGDVAEGLVRLAEAPGAGGAVNLGCGEARSIAEVLQRLRDFYSRPLKVVEVRRDEPFESSCADVTKLRELTGWVPPTDLAAGMQLVAEFERRQSAADIV